MSYCLALLSDVHGNLTALDSVLAYFDEIEPDQMICLGDVAASGPQPGQCIERLATRQIPNVRGNADAWLLSPTFDAESGSFMHKVEEADHWVAQQLKSEDMAYLAASEPVIRLDTPNPLLCFHGTPRSHSEVITAETPSDELIELFARHEEKLLAGGHTHQQLLRRIQDRTLINPGSVGLGYQVDRDGQPHNVPWAECAVIRWLDGRQWVSLHHIPFDVETHVRAIHTSGMPYADFWASSWP